MGKTISVSLDEEVQTALRAYMHAESMTASDVVRAALRVYLGSDPDRARYEGLVRAKVAAVSRWAYNELRIKLAEIYTSLNESLKMENMEGGPLTPPPPEERVE